MKKIFTFLKSRLVATALLAVLQMGLVVLLAQYLAKFFFPLMLVINIAVLILILNRDSNTDFKLSWVVLVLLFPVSGVLFYLLFGMSWLVKTNKRKLKNAFDSVCYSCCEKAAYIPVSDDERTAALPRRQFQYLLTAANTDVFEQTETEFFHPGINFFERMLKEIEAAEKFIFMEYFIIQKGLAFSQVYELLTKKAAVGVEVRIMFDDIGTLSKLPRKFAQTLRNDGLKVAVFNPLRTPIGRFLNYRDHRKYTIIDGKTAFTGGVNLSDEYMGYTERLGVWEDSAIMLKGDAVNRMTISFLQLWNFAVASKTVLPQEETPDYMRYLSEYKAKKDGLVIPFSDEPLTGEFVSANAYLNLIESAQSYVYICTPYLILDDIMSAAITRAAKSGIDIKIITPAIPDKKLVFLLTRANYRALVNSGVEIYEFTPGFMHTKAIVSDDLTAIVGTANFDYRSFYLHFENGVWMHKSKAVSQVKESFLKNLKLSQQITTEFIEKTPLFKRLLSSLLKVFAPMM